MISTVFLDFEYFGTEEKLLNPVCVTFELNKDIGTLWLYKDEDNQKKAREFILRHKDKPFCAFNVVAEASSFIALGLDPLDFKWIDLQLEYKMIINCRNEFSYGMQNKKGIIFETKPRPKDQLNLFTEEEIANLTTEQITRLFKMGKEIPSIHADPSYDLIACTYKMIGKTVDSDLKDEMRDLILTRGPYSSEDRFRIMKYCEEDVKNLPQIHFAIVKSQGTIDESERLWRGKVAAMTAKMTTEGYPINKEKVLKFQENLPQMTEELCKDINRQFETPFLEKNNFGKYKIVEQVVRDEIYKRYKNLWPKTAGGKISLDSKAFDKFLNLDHIFKEGDLLEQFVRYKKFLTSTNSIKNNSDADKNFLSACGKDSRVRAWLNPYGAQTSRFQPKATQFLFLKSAWMRSLCEPKKGRAIIGIDYGSQEFLLQGCVSEDEEIWKTYSSGDVYMDFGKKVGIIPEYKTKAEAKIERAAAKAAVLGIGYGMGKASLARKVETDTGKPTTEEDAQKLIDAYYGLYSKYNNWRIKTYREYVRTGKLKLPDGWIIYGDNPNKKSVLNFPLQGLGACIVRKAMELCYDSSLTPIFPLHDALYIECDVKDIDASLVKFISCMRNASGFYFNGVPKDWALGVKMEADIWGPDLKRETKIVENLYCSFMDIYIDERTKDEYERFKKYF